MELFADIRMNVVPSGRHDMRSGVRKYIQRSLRTQKHGVIRYLERAVLPVIMNTISARWETEEFASAKGLTFIVQLDAYMYSAVDLGGTDEVEM